ncbi:MAG: MBL fold metallo-hydrolase [Myxococcota bacterium]
MAVAHAPQLTEVAPGIHAWVQPDGSWGWSNAGVVVQGGESLLVDTLFDRALTARMLETMRERIPETRRIGTVVNTHANGDHCWGNELVTDSRIIASRAAADEMTHLPPSRVALLVKLARLATATGPLPHLAAAALRTLGLTRLGDLLHAAPLVERIFAPFHFGGITLRVPDETFSGRLELQVGGRAVELMEVGPAHTQGDVMVHVPDARTVFTGDILFIESHPIVWEGPISNWIAALDRVLALQPRVVVPGHGPLTDVAGVQRVRDYLRHVHTEAVRRFHAGMDAETAAKDISLSDYRGWRDAERIAVNVETVYRELQPGRRVPHVVEMFARMARVARAVQ